VKNTEGAKLVVIAILSRLQVRGMMQFMPKNWPKLGNGDATDPFNSIDAGGRCTQDMLGRYRRNVDAAITDEEVQALHQVIRELSDYIRRTAPAPEAMELLRRAKQIVGVTTRNL
jgi:hypothetical protein